MKSIKLFFVFSFGLLFSNNFAQSYTEELLKYSLTDVNGTARSIGVGGAFSTVGADLSCATSNPAGLGLYRSTEISLSLGGVLNSNKATFSNTTVSANKLNINLPHVGAVFAIPIKTSRGTNFLQLGIVYNRLADFGSVKEFKGINSYNSKVDVFYNEITSTNLPILYQNYAPGTVQAWNTYLLDTLPGGTFFKRVNGPVTQSGSYIEKGGSNEMNIALSGNINDKFYVGAAVGIPWMNYERSKIYNEEIVQYDSTYGFKSFSQSDFYKVSGVGLNLKLGIIVKPLPFWRIGTSITTPSAYFKLQETNNSAMTSVIDGTAQTYTFASDTFSSEPYRFSYSRPLKATFGTSFIISKWGFVSVDYELNDYKHIGLGFDDDQPLTNSFNQDFRKLYGIGHTIRAGAEFSWNVLRVRAGYQWNSTPFQSGVGVKGYDLQRQTFSGGLGYRGKLIFADLAFAHTMGGDFTSLYRATANEPVLLNKFTNNRLVLTVGFKFGGKKSN
jgi:hypothetical protein